MVILPSSMSLTVALQGAVAPDSAQPSCAGFPPAAEQGPWAAAMEHFANHACVNHGEGWVDVCPVHQWQWLSKDRMSWLRPFWMIPI